MARPTKNNAPYFGHDNNMRNHRKIKALRAKFPVVGYCVWCMFLEVLTECEGNRWAENELEEELLAGDFGVSVTEIRDILNYCISLELICRDNGVLYSQTLDERLKFFYQKRDLSRERARGQARNAGKFDSDNRKDGVSVTEIPQSKSISKGNLKNKEKEIINISFVEIWDLYGKKVGDKAKCQKHWETKLNDRDRKAVLDHIPIYLSTLDPKDTARKYQLQLQTYLNQRRWETDEYVAASRPEPERPPVAPMIYLNDPSRRRQRQNSENPS